MKRIDGHVHIFGDEDAVKLLDELDIKTLNICVAEGDWRQSDHPRYSSQAQAHPERFAWITTFDVPDFSVDDKTYAQRVIDELDKDFANGAVGVKAWKNIGMEVKKPDGSFLQIDDPMFTPIFEHLANIDKPIVMHMGEPLACWQPLKPGTPHYPYYSEHPQWHMYGRDDIPDHATLIAARDNVVERHPNVRIIGAHYGSLEYDMDEVAKRLDRFPNFAVDTSARLGDAAYQDREKVRNFYINYADRIIWGTDEPAPFTDVKDPEQRRALAQGLRDAYAIEWAFLSTDDELVIHNHPCRGLALPDDVLQKVCHDTARAWYPGV